MAEVINEAIPNTAAPPTIIQNTIIQKPLPVPLSDKLNNDNFLTWRYQAIQTISGAKLQHHLEKEKVPVHFASEEDRTTETETKAYQIGDLMTTMSILGSLHQWIPLSSIGFL
ncbi:hypothetical protein PIB30_067965, partial [Stylosanthes scabra]|nr:hypothetical protein [Stylosanthes scabra]